jgi:general secretion pathway protein D
MLRFVRMNILPKTMLAYTALALIGFLVGCAPLDRKNELSVDGKEGVMRVDPSYLKGNTINAGGGSEVVAAGELSPEAHSEVVEGFRRIDSLGRGGAVVFQQNILSHAFNDTPSIKVTAEAMPFRDFLHYVFGDLLGVNYVLDDGVKKNVQPVTMSVVEEVSPRKLFELTVELLGRRGVQIQSNEGLYYIQDTSKDEAKDVVAAIGSSASDVPQTTQDILQIVPLSYGLNTSAERTFRELVDAKIVLDTEQNAAFIRGKRQQVLRALDFIKLLDTPANRGRYIGLVKITYMSASELAASVETLLDTEGVKVSSRSAKGSNVVMVPIEKLGALAIFATSEELLERARYWAQQLDQPSQGDTLQYFVFNPKYSRASDLGQSLSNLMDGGSLGANQTTSTTGNLPNGQSASGISSQSLNMVVDDRSNALIFHTTGVEYQRLLPLMTELDVMPRQVVLDITIAEVTLGSEFQNGVEWALAESEVGISTQGAFGVDNIGGVGVVIDGIKGPLVARFLETNNMVNVLSRPTLLVRDGVTANINVGSDISVVGATTTDPINSSRQTTSTQYRKTGVNVTVTPTINARGVVIMEIDQSISNTVSSSTGAGGNPDIFERSIKTEVVAASGQSVMLGGLRSANASSSGRAVPGIGKLPGLGWLFGSSGNSATQTELIMLVTPRIVNDNSEWDAIAEDLRQGFQYLSY